MQSDANQSQSPNSPITGKLTGNFADSGQFCHSGVNSTGNFNGLQLNSLRNRTGNFSRRLAGRIFDDRGNRMSPTHSNKLGVRYRYYVSHAVLQKRKAEAGAIARVPAPEMETLVLDGVRKHLAATAAAEPPIAMADRDLIERHVERIVVKPNAIEVRLIVSNDEPAREGDENGRDDTIQQDLPLPTLVLLWAPQSFSAVKGDLHAPAPSQTLKPSNPKCVTACSRPSQQRALD
jgi:hypothetical protein